MPIIVKKGEQGSRRHHGCLWAALIGILIYAACYVVAGVLLGQSFSSSTAKLKSPTVYKLNLEGTLVEQAPEEDPFAAFLAEMPSMMQQEKVVGLDQILSNIRLAKSDDRIVGIYLHGGQMLLGTSQAKEIRDALLDFKQSGKWIIAYADAYSQVNYYIVSVADRIYLNPVGVVDWKGLSATKMYFKRILDKIGVQMQILKVGTFKSAVEPFFLTSMSDADRKQTEVYVNGIWDHVVREVALSRGSSEQQMRAYADEYMALQPLEKALAYGLIDSLVYSQSMDSILVQYAGTKDYQALNTAKLASVERPSRKADKQIAVVYMEGQIYDDGTEGITAKEMLKTLRKVQKEKNLAAVVLRVNSPGGSANASEQIWHAVRLIQEQGIPVVVSMSNYAASGGYYISCEADYIYAEPMTLTGSIGIFGTVPNFAQLRDKVGLDVDEVHTNTHSSFEMNAVAKGMNPSERQLMQSMVERGYDLFTSRCAEGRHMSQEAIKQIGEGRVWLGQDALRLGLIDGLGNMDSAIMKASCLAGIDQYQLVYYPECKDPLDEIMKIFDDSTEEEKLLARMRAFVREPRILTLAPVVTIE